MSGFLVLVFPQTSHTCGFLPFFFAGGGSAVSEEGTLVAGVEPEEGSEEAGGAEIRGAPTSLSKAGPRVGASIA